MKRAVKGLDHVVGMVDGIDAAEVAYRKLGFQVQPRGFHKKLGTANHLMIFDTDYFEILGLVEDTEFNAERREWLKDGGGLGGRGGARGRRCQRDRGGRHVVAAIGDGQGGDIGTCHIGFEAGVGGCWAGQRGAGDRWRRLGLRSLQGGRSQS